ncbi:Protein phosphatase [Balamuthia mandrillaris]
MMMSWSSNLSVHRPVLLATAARGGGLTCKLIVGQRRAPLAHPRVGFNTLCQLQPRRCFASTTHASGGGVGGGTAGQTTTKHARVGCNFHFRAAAYNLPHPDKAQKGGEDAYYISDTEKSLGVADGVFRPFFFLKCGTTTDPNQQVGGWATHNIDPALFSRKLMEEAHKAADIKVKQMLMESKARLHQEEAKQHKSPLVTTDILDMALQKTKHITGSSTALVLLLDDCVLNASYLGDSSFMVIRDSQIIHRSEEQQHYFNCPYQLGSDGDSPRKAVETTLEMQEGDIIIVGTDGLFDNMFDKQILDLVNQAKQKGMSEEAIAQLLAKNAQAIAKKPNVEVPFGVNCYKMRGLRYLGGKLDDVCVIVAAIQRPNKNKL